MRTEVGYDKDFIAGTCIPVVKQKPLDALSCKVTMRVDDVTTGEVVRETVTHNLRKDAFADFIASLNLTHYSFFNGESGIPATDNEMLSIFALYDENAEETALFNPFEGEVKGRVDASIDYNGNDPLVGTRNNLTTSIKYDPIEDYLTCTLEVTFDETKLVGEKVNKLLVCTSNASTGTDATGTGYRKLSSAKGHELRQQSIFMGVNRPQYQHLSRAHKSLLTFVDGVDADKFVLQGLSLSQPSVYGDFREEDLFSLDFGKSDTVLNYSQNTTYRLVRNNDSLEIVIFNQKDASTIGYRKYTVAGAPESFNGKTLTPELVEEVDYVHEFSVDSSVGMGAVATTVGWDLVCTIDNRAGVLHIDTASQEVTATTTALQFHPRHAARISDDVYLVTVCNSHFESQPVAQARVHGGYFDIKNKRFIECMTSGNVSDTGIKAQYFCSDTGYMYDFSAPDAIVYLPIEYVPPFRVLHVDVGPTISKERNQRIQMRYDIRIPNILTTMTNPFTKVANLNSDVMLIDSGRKTADLTRHDSRGLIPAVGKHKQFPDIVSTSGDTPLFSGKLVLNLIQDTENDTAKVVATYAGLDGVSKASEWVFDYWDTKNPPKVTAELIPFKTPSGVSVPVTFTATDYLTSGGKMAEIDATIISSGGVKLVFTDPSKLVANNPVGLNSAVTIPLSVDQVTVDRDKYLSPDAVIKYSARMLYKYNGPATINIRFKENGDGSFNLVGDIQSTGGKIPVNIALSKDLNPDTLIGYVYNGRDFRLSTNVSNTSAPFSSIKDDYIAISGYFRKSGRNCTFKIAFYDADGNTMYDTDGNPINMLDLALNA